MTGHRAYAAALALAFAAGACAVSAAPAGQAAQAVPAAQAIQTGQIAQPQTDAAPTREAVQATVQTMRADPNLPGVRTAQTLRLKPRGEKPEDQPQKADDGSASWLRWIRRAAAFVADGARVLVWLIGAALVVWILWRVRRWMAWRGDPVARGRQAPLPSHVGRLDIRPESLPDDIGAAAANVWRRGEARAALSLLYRGALSRLVHGPAAVPVRAASTEDECLALAQGRLPADVCMFFAGLVGIWQQAAYGGRLPETAQVLALCDGFASNLPLARASAAVGDPHTPARRSAA